MLLTRTGRRVAAAVAAATLILVPFKALAEPTVEQRAVALPAFTGNIPKPETYFGFKMGTTGKLATFPKIKQYLQLVAQRSDRAKYEVVGTTTDGNEFPVLFLSSPDNLRNLDRIVEMNERLSNPRGLTPAQARALAEQSVPIHGIEATLHSTEVANTPAVVDVIYRLATENSSFTSDVLDNAVIMVIPSGNPDGQHKLIDHFNATEGTDLNRVYPDLYQTYVGHDNNRDWFMFTQAESRIRVRLEQKYRPVVMHYGHQAGTGSPRIWLPPYDEPLSRNHDPIMVEAANSLGLAVGRQLVAEGKTGISHDNAYGILWNADVSGYSAFRGTTLFMHEVATVRDLAYPFTSANGAPLGPQDRGMNNVAPYRGNTWTLEQAVDYATTSYYTAMKQVADNGPTWLYNNLYQIGRNSLTWNEGAWAYVLPADQRDPYATFEMLDIFEFGQVEIHQATKPFTAGGKEYPAKSYVLKTQQPMGRWVDQLLKIEPYPNSARKCATCPLIMPYSETTDHLGMLLGVDVDPIKDPFDATLKKVTSVDPPVVRMPNAPKATGAYLVSPNSYAIGKFLAELQKADIPVFRSAGEFAAANRTFAPGTVIVPPTDQARSVLARVSVDTGVPIYSSNTTPAVQGFQLKPGTRVGLVRGANNMPGGWMMWLLEQYGINYQVVSADDYAGAGLAAKYDTIVFADGITKARIVNGLDPARVPAQFHWARGVGEAGWAQLKSFVEGGGNLVAVGDGADTARELLSLPVTNAAPTDRTQFSAPGTLLHNRFDPTVPAAWGMRDQWPVWFFNDSAYRVDAGSQARVAASYPTSGEVMAVGYAHGQDALRGLANVVSFEVGQGNVTIAGSQITFRSWPRSALPLVFNSIYQGPSTAVTAPQLR